MPSEPQPRRRRRHAGDDRNGDSSDWSHDAWGKKRRSKEQYGYTDRGCGEQANVVLRVPRELSIQLSPELAGDGFLFGIWQDRDRGNERAWLEFSADFVHRFQRFALPPKFDPPPFGSQIAVEFSEWSIHTPAQLDLRWPSSQYGNNEAHYKNVFGARQIFHCPRSVSGRTPRPSGLPSGRLARSGRRQLAETASCANAPVAQNIETDTTAPVLDREPLYLESRRRRSSRASVWNSGRFVGFTNFGGVPAEIGGTINSGSEGKGDLGRLWRGRIGSGSDNTTLEGVVILVPLG